MRGTFLAGSLNKVILIGHLGAEPEIRTFENDGSVARLRIATSEHWRDRNSGERQERTEWHTVSIYPEGLVNVAKQFLRKGSKIYVEGRLRTRKWQDQQGNSRYSTEVLVRGLGASLILLDPTRAVAPKEPIEIGTDKESPPAKASPPKPKANKPKPQRTANPKPTPRVDPSENPDPDWRPSDKLCVVCGEPITIGRARALPETKVCIDCAAHRPAEPRRIDEPLGNRDDFKKDSGKNFGSAGTNRNF